jgi:uncharacterized BrkB/YihY/UPF0761 family membrane protein
VVYCRIFDLITAESIASSLMSIRLVFVAFVLTIFAVLLRMMPNNPLNWHDLCRQCLH